MYAISEAVMVFVYAVVGQAGASSGQCACTQRWHHSSHQSQWCALFRWCPGTDGSRGSQNEWAGL